MGGRIMMKSQENKGSTFTFFVKTKLRTEIILETDEYLYGKMD